MTSHVGRLYATAVAILAFFLAWAGIAARPLGDVRRRARSCS